MRRTLEVNRVALGIPRFSKRFKMALACQKNSFLKQLTTTVKSCSPGEYVVVSGKQKEKLIGYDVILEDTVLFPEGGGQPDDRGTINGIEVLRVTRKGASAIHFLQSPLDAGVAADVQVDWQRRFDHMQQHSGQHLVTAIAEKLYGCKTTSWNLGAAVSTIDLDAAVFTPEQLTELEAAVNEAIRSALPMTPSWYDSGAPELEQVRARGLPDDHVGTIRVVTIAGIDSNMCCGTHVSNLAQLQAIKLLYTEPWKQKVKLTFVAGNRVLEYLGRCCSNEKLLNSLLNCRPEEYASMVKKTQDAARNSLKQVASLLRDLAIAEAVRVKAKHAVDSDGCPDELLTYHRDDGDNEFMNLFVNEINDQARLTFVTVGGEGGNGSFLLAGPQDLLDKCGPKVAAVMDGKGGGRGGRYQGKVNKVGNRNLAKDLIRSILNASLS